ncbi:predicted protein [Methanosarcina acetivorans C2A]|uniref:Uncharacterized protein n=2 Tax=Methanosarcina acetivorans TaxID=2214 RepID=Q8TLZ2_METAC|nr:predicted protein [Methanosarcina acetivorans C2A]
MQKITYKKIVKTEIYFFCFIFSLFSFFLKTKPDESMADVLLKFTRVLKNGTVFYNFEGFENVKSRWELPCEYLSGSHFAAWNGVLLYSDGNAVKPLSPGSVISENEHLELMKIVELGKKRLSEIQAKMKI